MTSAVSDSVTRHVVRPAHTRRTTMPTARMTPTAMSSPRIATVSAAVTSSPSKRGTISSSVIRRTTIVEPTVHAA